MLGVKNHVFEYALTKELLKAWLSVYGPEDLNSVQGSEEVRWLI